MTSSANETPPAAPATPSPASATPPETSPVVNMPAPANGTGVTAPRAHWTRGAWNGASKLISTAANDELVRNMIGQKARSQVAATVFGGTVMGAIAARIATRSVPGALLVGGALLAKAVYDQRKEKAKGTIPKA